MMWKRTAVTGAILAAMAAPLIVMPTHANADLASAVETGSHSPVVTIVTPQYADVVKGSSVSITVAVQQRSNPVKGLEMFVDDHIATPGWVPLKSLQSSSFNWDTTLFKNGPHKLTVRVIDSQGMIGQAEITIYVNNAAQSQQQDTSAPALKWLGVQNGQVLKGVVNLQLQASDNFGVKYIFVMLNSTSDPDKKPALRSWMINQPPYIIPFDTTKVNDGSYVLDALAYDALSNQGEAPRLNVSIANNTINPTYLGTNVPSTDTDTTPNSTEDTAKPSSGDLSNSTTAPDTTNTKSVADIAPSSTPTPSNTNSEHTSNTTVASAPPVPYVPPVAPTLIPQPPRQGALHDNNRGNSDNANNNDGHTGLTTEVTSSAQIQQPSAQPRVTPLPTRLAANHIPPQTSSSDSASNTLPKTTLANPSLFASLDDSLNSSALSSGNDQPITTMALSQLSSLPADSNTIKPQVSKAAPVLEAKLPSPPVFNTNAAIENSMRQTQPLSTIVNTQSPDSMLTESKLEQIAPQRYFQVNDAISMPVNAMFVAPVKVKAPSVPQFPQPSLIARTPENNITPVKSTFDAPLVGMTDANVASRITPATQRSHTAPVLMANAQLGALPGYVAPTPVSTPRQAVSNQPRSAAPAVGMTDANVASRITPAAQRSHAAPVLVANAQIGALPGYVAPKHVSAPRHIVSSQPLFTAPAASTMASSRIASANISGKSWGYQHSAQSASVKSTKPKIAFLPKLNSEPKTDSFASITVSPISTKMQVSEMTQSWPAIYRAKQHERLSAIAERYGLPVEVLAKNNSLQNGAVLTAGQKIKMPRNLQVTYNGKALHSDVSSMLVGTTSVAAFRFLFEQQGGKVTWDPTTQTVHAKNDDNEITVTIGSKQAVVNQRNVMMDLAAFLLSGRTMVPVRLFEKSLNAQVTWDPSTGRMFMAMAG